MTPFVISGLPSGEFQPLYAMTAAQLMTAGIVERTVDEEGAYPCRITLEDAHVGEQVLLLNYQHLRTSSPYAASGPIFIRRNASRTQVSRNEVPTQQRRRLLSVRAYDASDSIVDGDVTPGTELDHVIERFFRNTNVTYLHVHNARYGCYACRVDRIQQ